MFELTYREASYRVNNATHQMTSFEYKHLEWLLWRIKLKGVDIITFANQRKTLCALTNLYQALHYIPELRLGMFAVTSYHTLTDYVGFEHLVRGFGASITYRTPIKAFLRHSHISIIVHIVGSLSGFKSINLIGSIIKLCTEIPQNQPLSVKVWCEATAICHASTWENGITSDFYVGIPYLGPGAQRHVSLTSRKLKISISVIF